MTDCSGVARGGGWVDFYLPPLGKKLSQTKKLFKIARGFKLKKIYTPHKKFWLHH